MIKNIDKKKLIYILGGILGGIIILITIIFIVIGASNKKLSFENIENRLATGAKNYMLANEAALPKEEGSSVTIDAETLESGNYIKSISKMLKEGVSCSAKVIVTKNGDNYLYSPMLNCGESYKTEKLVTRILSDNTIKQSGDGLYKNNDGYIFKGEYVNNYISLDNKLWRIMSIDADGYARIIYSDKLSEDYYIWDDRYNVDSDDYLGINDYSVSRIKEKLDALEDGNKIVTTSISNLAYRPICIGKRSSTNVEINNNEECETVINSQLFGLPYVSDYASASIDNNCKTIEDESCSNYNYLYNMKVSSYTLTGVKEKSSKVYFVSGNRIAKINAIEEKTIQLTAYLSNNSLYADGEGTKSNPYTLK